jgi:ParB family transcriptional regulator, chromosome partitioning protein
MNAKKKAALGRGLNALLGDSEYGSSQVQSYVSATPNIPIDQISANPWQPRTDFEKQSIDELAVSIKNQGIIQPITVRKTDEGFQLISGERRLRAAKIAGLTEIPAYIREVEDIDLLELALVENIQRENLNAIEVAHSFQRLIEECGITQDQLSDKVGKKRTTITNYLRLLKLPPSIQIGIRDHKISMGHARSLINIPSENTQLDIFQKIIEKGLSVRQVEEIVRHLQQEKHEKPVSKKIVVSAEIQKWKKSFTDKTNAKVSVKIAPTGKGTISISFKNPEHLSNILKHIQ